MDIDNESATKNSFAFYLGDETNETFSFAKYSKNEKKSDICLPIV